MQRRFIRHRAVMSVSLVIMGALITFVLFGNNIRLQAVHATPQMRSLPATSFSNVLSTFYPNPNDSGVFDVTSTTTPAFTQSFPTLDFNPPISLQFCTNSTGVDENTRPFTNISQNADGSCTNTIAPASGTVAWIGKDKSANEFCVGLTLDVGNINMTICHFASLNGDLSNKHVGQGYFLGIMADHIHISMDDRYLDTTHGDCSPVKARTCRPVPFDGYYAVEGQNYDPGDPNANWQPVLNQYGCPQLNDSTCRQITSTNQETTTTG